MAAKPFEISQPPGAPLSVGRTARKYRLSKKQFGLVKAFIAANISSRPLVVDHDQMAVDRPSAVNGAASNGSSKNRRTANSAGNTKTLSSKKR